MPIDTRAKFFKIVQYFFENPTFFKKPTKDSTAQITKENFDAIMIMCVGINRGTIKNYTDAMKNFNMLVEAPTKWNTLKYSGYLDFIKVKNAFEGEPTEKLEEGK